MGTVAVVVAAGETMGRGRGGIGRVISPGAGAEGRYGGVRCRRCMGCMS